MLEIDNLPELTQYHDDGCYIAPRCLACPLSVCQYDMPPKRARIILRGIQINQLLNQGQTVDDIAQAIGITRRSVFRIRRITISAGVIMVLPHGT